MADMLLAGCGRYIQGAGILDQIGVQLKSLLCRRPLIIGGKKAMSAAFPRLAAGLNSKNISYNVSYFSGHCTDEAIKYYSTVASDNGCDCIIGVGGGKVLDTAKAVANANNVPIICVPTSAATCAATTPLSIIYSEEGKQIRIDFFDREVDTVICDTEIIAQAPVRLMASGIADSFAKLCEYSSPYSQLEYGQKGLGIYCGYTLSLAANEILFQNGEQACKDIENNIISRHVEECAFVNIALIGVISGLGGYGEQGKGRFAIAHALNEVIRNHYPDIGEKWLHGEVVGVGVLAQLAVNGSDSSYVDKTRSLLKSIGAPVSLGDLGLDKDLELVDFAKYLISQSSFKGDHEKLFEIIDNTI